MKIVIMLLVLNVCLGPAMDNDLSALDSWGFNEGNSDSFINSAGSYGNGRLYGHYKWGNGNYISFDGKSAYGLVNCITENGKDLKTNTFSVCCRVKLDRLPEKDYFTLVSGLKNNFCIRFHGKKTETWIIVSWLEPETGNRYSITSGLKNRKLKPGEWLRLMFSIDGEKARLYVNGELDIYDTYYFVKKGSTKGTHIALIKNDGLSYKGSLCIKGLTFGVEKRGSIRRNWFPGSIDYLLLFKTGLTKNDIPDIDKLLQKSNLKKALPIIDL